MTCGLLALGRGSGERDCWLLAQSDLGLSRDHEGLLWRIPIGIQRPQERPLALVTDGRCGHHCKTVPRHPAMVRRPSGKSPSGVSSGFAEGQDLRFEGSGSCPVRSAREPPGATGDRPRPRRQGRACSIPFCSPPKSSPPDGVVPLRIGTPERESWRREQRRPVMGQGPGGDDRRRLTLVFRHPGGLWFGRHLLSLRG
jgi:hypothetical protein